MYYSQLLCLFCKPERCPSESLELDHPVGSIVWLLSLDILVWPLVVQSDVPMNAGIPVEIESVVGLQRIAAGNCDIKSISLTCPCRLHSSSCNMLGVIL